MRADGGGGGDMMCEVGDMMWEGGDMMCEGGYIMCEWRWGEGNIMIKIEISEISL